MRKNLIWAVVLSLVAVFVSFSCGGGGGGGTGSGVTVDNTKASGIFTYVFIDASFGFTVDRGTLTLDGAGHGTFSSLASGGSGTFNYTVTVPGNTLTIDSSSTSIGAINSAGNFFTVGDVTGNNILYGVKQATSYTDTSATYMGGEFALSANTQVTLFSLITATPAGVVSFTNLTSGGTITIDYTIASNGTFTVYPAMPDTFGAISADKNIFISSDTETINSTQTAASIALKVPGSGMTLASLNGTYTGFEFYDENAGLGAPSYGLTRATLTFNGAGNGTYTIIQDSLGYTGSFPFTYTMSANGSFLIDGAMPGIALQDGSVLTFGDDSSLGDAYISAGVAIKQ